MNLILTTADLLPERKQKDIKDIVLKDFHLYVSHQVIVSCTCVEYHDGKGMRKVFKDRYGEERIEPIPDVIVTDKEHLKNLLVAAVASNGHTLHIYDWELMRADDYDLVYSMPNDEDCKYLTIKRK
jgi:hypothetical protein